MVLHSFAQIYHIIQLLLKNVRRCTFSGKQNQRLDLVKIINEHILSALLQHNNHFRISNIWVLKDLVRYESKSSVILSWHCLDVLKFYICYSKWYKFIFQTRQFSHMSYCALGLRTQEEMWFRKTEPQNVFKTKCSNTVMK